MGEQREPAGTPLAGRTRRVSALFWGFSRRNVTTWSCTAQQGWRNQAGEGTPLPLVSVSSLTRAMRTSRGTLMGWWMNEYQSSESSRRLYVRISF